MFKVINHLLNAVRSADVFIDCTRLCVSAGDVAIFVLRLATY